MAMFIHFSIAMLNCWRVYLLAYPIEIRTFDASPRLWQVTGAQEIAPGLWMGGDVAQILHRVAQNQVDGPLVRLCSWSFLWGFNCDLDGFYAAFMGFYSDSSG